MWLTVWKIRYNYIKTRKRRKESTNSQTWPKIESAELQLIGWRCTRPHYARYFAMRRNWAGILHLCLEIIWIWGEKKKKLARSQCQCPFESFMEHHSNQIMQSCPSLANRIPTPIILIWNPIRIKGKVWIWYACASVPSVLRLSPCNVLPYRLLASWHFTHLSRL